MLACFSSLPAPELADYARCIQWKPIAERDACMTHHASRNTHYALRLSDHASLNLSQSEFLSTA